MRVVLSIVVPTYRRPASFLRLCTSVQRFAPPGTELIAIVQSPETIPPAGVRVYWAHPGLPGPHRHLGAQMARGEILLFLDDDHELLPAFHAAWRELHALVCEPALVSLPLRDGLPTRPRSRVVALSGGMLVTRAVYERVGGFGADYLDDIEFCLRCRWAGIPVRRAPVRVTVHHGGEPGGLRALDGVAPKRSAHLRLSRLDERYPGRLVRDPRSWWGFREVGR